MFSFRFFASPHHRVCIQNVFNFGLVQQRRLRCSLFRDHRVDHRVDHLLVLSTQAVSLIYLGSESHFVGVHGPYELHRKEQQIKFTSFNNKVCCDIAYFNTKMSYLSDFKRTKSKTLRTAKQTEDELNKSAQ